MGVLKVWDGTAWVPVSTSGADGAPGAPGAAGAAGADGPPGPTAVSTDANNGARLGVDGLLYVAGATPWTAPTFQNGWTNYDSVNQAARYRKVGDITYIEGMVKGTTLSTIMFTLPVGFRPPMKMQFAQLAAAAFAILVVDNTGAVTASSIGNVANFTINCSFSVT